ncbi:hypothetical protein ElyMa_001084200 [Elysia marginata]|uniref:PRELI/MSF1 domain-containing protein n=1 Tax=Elysia marginata TaxID=1093978 RepID=A0AAV4HSQ2_9GAST|nr:hypothetical protein ElyMa_001084200 [Elysia marginata]
MTDSMERSLSSTYIRMLRKYPNIHWSSHTTNYELYGKHPRVHMIIAERRLRLAGHCYQHPKLSTQELYCGSLRTEHGDEEDQRQHMWTL